MSKANGDTSARCEKRSIPPSKNLASKGDEDKGKRLSVEKIYQKKTQLEHILLRPDTYIGSLQLLTQSMWVYDEDIGVNCREISFVPGLYKIFDEILVNAADNKQRDKNMSGIKITIDPEKNVISIWNNGKGIPVVEHKVEKMFVPALIFGKLLTSSNFNDEEKKVTGGRNGFGAKLCNIFSKKFTVETACKESKKQFKQTWTNNMEKTSEPRIKPFEGIDFTCISFEPDLAKFQMEKLDKDTVALLTRRAYDLAGSCKGVKVYLNGKRLPVSGFRSYVDLYVKDKVDEFGNPLKVVHESVNDRWEVCLTLSEKGFQQVSFVNSIATTKGGRHVDYMADQIVTKLIEVVKKRNKAGVQVKPFQVRNHIWLFVNCLIENPTFDSQTKENMTLQVKSFGSTCPLPEKFIKGATNCGIVESILNWVKFKAQTLLNKKCSSVKHSKLRGVPKLDDANSAGGKNSQLCTLILTEGDSAKSLAITGLGVVGRDYYGVFPLRGKMLNVREASHKQIMENQEINNIIKIMGLQYKIKYEDPESLKTLRYGKLMIMADQDQDGSHIKGLLINFIHHNWPSLLKHSFLEEFITPIVKVSKRKEELSFYSLPEFETWKKNVDNFKTWKTKYYKGLGTSTAKEAKEYFVEMSRHRIPFKYSGPDDDAAITLAFSKKKVDDRKEWLTNWMEDRRQRRLHGLPEQFLYGKETKHLTYNDFINKELILFSNSDNERSIPSLVDGLKPGQRKVLFTCFKRNDKREVKVTQLAGSIAEMSAYHHGEQSLMMTVINLTQNFVGSNNVNLLQPIGQFGTRLHGGKDAASPRYIFTMLSPLTRLLFPAVDDNLLRFLYDDNLRVEPEWYCPIIPMVLVNGADGIGTGWASKIPNYDPREIVNNICRMLDGQELLPMMPRYKNFKGTIDSLGPNQFLINGEINVLENKTVEIIELPVRTWTQYYKETVLENMLHGINKTPVLISDYKEYHTDTTVKFVVKMTEEKLNEVEAAGFHRVFKLQTPLTCNSMVLFDHMGCLKKYETVQDIMLEFYDVRLRYYGLRKDWLDGMFSAESAKLNNQVRFILEKIEGKITIENKAKRELIQLLLKRGYESDPVKSWKESQDKVVAEETTAGDSDSDSGENETSTGPDFNYILNMPLWCLSKERKDELLKQKIKKAQELNTLRKKSSRDLWKEDLAAFVEELDRVEAQEREDEQAGFLGRATGKSKTAKAGGKLKQLQLKETQPSPTGRRVVPRVTAAMRTEASKKTGRKKVKVECEEASPIKLGLGDEFGETELQDADDEQKVVPAKQPPKKRKSEPGARLARKPPAPKKPKRNPWSDDEDTGDGISNSDTEDVLGGMDLVQRESKPRRASAINKKYTFDASDGEGSEEEVKEEEVREEEAREEEVREEEDDLDLDKGDAKKTQDLHSSDDDEDEEEKSFETTSRTKAESKRSGSSSPGSWDEVESPSLASAAKSRLSRHADVSSSDEEASRPALCAPPMHKVVSRKQAAAHKADEKPLKVRKRLAPKAESGSSNSDDDDFRPKAAKKGRAGGGRKRQVSESDTSDDNFSSD
uniref:DNA topoisomerase 2-beta n=1 Tax=Myxine glutinosa TaxID=7769 RepID=UPI00358E4619